METETIIQVLIVGGVAYLLSNLIALLVSDRLLFVPQDSSYNHLPGEVKIKTGDGERIHAVYLEHPDPRKTILFSHGNAEDLGNVMPFMQQFHERGYSVLMYDYRGYGGSDGRPSTSNAKEDVTAAYHWLVDEKKVDPASIISQGRSLGGGLAVWLAAHRRVGGLITEISFASAIRVKTRWKIFPWDKFDSLKLIRQVDCPVLVIHGTDDRVIPQWHGKKVYEAAPSPKRCLWIEEGRHSNYAYVDEAQYLATIDSFVDDLLD